MRFADGRLRLFAAIVLVAAVLTVVSLLVPRIVPWAALRDPASPLVQFVDVRSEANLNTWFNVALLSVGAALHACVARIARRTGRPSWPWMVTASGLALLAIDDLAAVHEKLEPLGRSLGGGEGITHFAWIVPGLVLAGVLAAGALAVARRLPRRSMGWLVGGIAVLLTAAVGMEALGGAVISGVGDGLAYILVSHVEEFAETCAAGMLLCAATFAISVHQGSPSSALVVDYLDAR
jgi:hypothetical protein